MLSPEASQKPTTCYVCQSQAESHCGYCLLPLCMKHELAIRPWFTSQLVMVCLSCQRKLEMIARQEDSLDERHLPHRLAFRYS